MKPFKPMLLALMLSTSAATFAAPTLHDRYADAELVTILKNDGYSAIEQVEEGVIRIKINGDNYALINNDDGDLQTYYGFSGFDISYKDINEWNKSKRLSRAYIDDDNDPVIEADLLANAGLSDEHVTEFFDVFTQSVHAFRNFLYEHDKEGK